jgi:signal transduction histidine kinase
VLHLDKPVEIVKAVQFEIFDTGIGISLKNQSNMFQLFGKIA